MFRVSNVAECLRANVLNGEKTVNIRALKALVFSRFPKTAAIYEVMLIERDSLSVFELLVKIDVWLRLLRRISD